MYYNHAEKNDIQAVAQKNCLINRVDSLEKYCTVTITLLIQIRPDVHHKELSA